MPSTENLAVLKGQRKTIKSACTRIKTYLDGIDTVIPEIIPQIKVRKETLESYWSKYDEVQSQIELIERDEKFEERTKFEDAYFDLIVRIENILQSFRNTNGEASARAENVSPLPTNIQSQQTFNVGSCVRLPKLNLPTFAGNYQEWTAFAQMFRATIISNNSLTNIEKLQYLISALSGDAADSIQSLDITDVNFQVAWNILEQRYNKVRVIVQSHVQAIMDIHPLKRENYIGLRSLVNEVTKHVNSLKTLRRPVEQWDDLLIHMLSHKLDPVSFREWEGTLTGNNFPTLEQLLQFLNHRCQTLEALSKRENMPLNNNNSKQIPNRKTTVTHATIKPKCIFCSGEHPIYFCKSFLDLSPNQRSSEVKKRKLCMNCLKSNSHHAQQCTAGVCRTCGSKHNTLLHFKQEQSTQCKSDPNTKGSSEGASNSSAIVTHSSIHNSDNYILLSTALVDVIDSSGCKKQCRVLLDSGSQANLISKECVSRLNLKTRHKDISITGINQITTNANRTVEIKLLSRHNKFQTNVECIVADGITEALPSMPVNKGYINIPKNIRLADPEFHVPSHVDILLGAGVFWQLMCIGQIKATPHNPTMQKTHLGWIIAGSIPRSVVTRANFNTFFVTSNIDTLNHQLTKFWQIEDNVKTVDTFSPTERACEEHFIRTTTSNECGRLIVSLPIKPQGLDQLGESRHTALKRFYHLERRLNNNEPLRLDYSKFINEYISLGHMKQIDEENDDPSRTQYYMPHHCVFKENSPTTKLRVVFDASCQTNSGVSLNDILMVGPVIQQDLFSLVSRFRTFPYVFTADITKMYRQILVQESDRSLQRILWRESSNEPIKTFELQTITYGTASASYLSTRCLKYLAETNRQRFPLGSHAVETDFYVDDLLTGARSLSEAFKKREEIISVLKTGQFVLNKWASNHDSLLRGLPNLSDNQELVTFDSESESHILGLKWLPKDDVFLFSVNSSTPTSHVSKRTMLSEIAQLFDPLGLLGPVIIIAKLLLQELWQLKTDWDASVPMSIHTQWSSFKRELSEVNNIRIPRLAIHCNEIQDIEFHGFSDASQSAYGAACYIRTKNHLGSYKIILIASKSRVAPLKAISLPRLELCAALLLAQLFNKVVKAIDLPISRTFFWTDSSITLSWIRSSSRKWNTFVANRVGEIQRLTDHDDWRHVESKFNPADLVSRGTLPRTLSQSLLWWHGPEWLSREEHNWPVSNVTCVLDELPEARSKGLVVNFDQNSLFIDELIAKFSSFQKLMNVVTYILRFANNLRVGSSRLTGPLNPEETRKSIQVISCLVQAAYFSEDLSSLRNGRPLSSTSKILSLSPFLDEAGIIRVGGRLRGANLPYSARHPILLPKNHPFSTLIIRHEHVRNLHAGVQATIYAVREQFWPIFLKSTTQRIIRQCITCFRVKPSCSEAVMSDLPASRVTPSRPFTHCGVDYGGPFLVREGKRRNARLVKVYISMFVCFATKATHIELVADLTTESFLGAFKRFTSRRGKPSYLYSDNGTNFVGAFRELKEMYDMFQQEATRLTLHKYFAESRIEWKFITPHSPHFGGLWEAAIKSAKFHMKRIIGNASLNYDEMTTVLCQIESILNSRPLSELSNDPNDLRPLTPGHFLIGDSLNSCVQPNLTDVNMNRLNRWQRIEQMRQHFWQRWNKEYLNHLQVRNKWKLNKGEQLKSGQLVLIHQPGAAPLQWLLGRIESLNTGPDGIARSAVVKTKNGSLVRPLTKLSILPLKL